MLAAVTVCAAKAQPPVARPQPPPPAPTTKAPATKAPAKPGTTAAPAPAPPQQPATRPQAAPATAAAQLPAAATEAPPSPAQLNAPVLPGAQFLASYDAGMGQRFYLYGSGQAFADVVAYYRTVLKDRGELVFDEPATHMFEVGRFKESEVAFPPGVTVKDYTWGGSPGYMNPRLGATPGFFPTVIQIVPPPPALAGRRD
jgi:hypothetical protein